MKVSCHIITLDRAKNLERVLYNCWWFFDKIRVCDGGSSDNTVQVCKKFNCQLVQNEWNGDMAEQHNRLLEEAKKDEWIFILDDDEYPSNQLLFELPNLIKTKENILYQIPSMMEIDGILQCPVLEMVEKVKNGQEQFRKDILFQYDSGIYFEGSSHYALKGFSGKQIPVAEPIIHFKTPEEIIWCDIYQGFLDFKTQGFLVDIKQEFIKKNINTIQELREYLDGGSISQDLKDIFIKYKSPTCGTISRFYQWYFLIHHADELPLTYGIVDDAIIRHIRDLGGFRSYSVWDDGEEYLPVGHLQMSKDLRRRIDTNLVPTKPIKIDIEDYDIEKEDLNIKVGGSFDGLNTEKEDQSMVVPEFGSVEIMTEEELIQMLVDRVAYDSNGYTGLLYRYANKISGNILEIGAWQGHSASVLGAVCQFRQKGVVYSIDREKSFYPTRYIYDRDKFNGVIRIQHFLEALMKVGVEDVVIPILCTSEMASKFITDPDIELVFVDGAHDYTNCSFDIETWGNVLKTGGYLIIHDYHPEIAGDQVARAVSDLLQSNSLWKLIEEKGMTVVWQKR